MTVKKRPWMPFYPADYLADTSHLTTQQHGAYVLLLLRYWVAGGIPQDDEQLAQITRLPLDVWLIEKPTILAFFASDLTHKRVEIELKKSRAISRVRRASAKQRHVKAAKSVSPAEFSKAASVSQKADENSAEKTEQIVASSAQAVDLPDKNTPANALHLHTQSQSQSQKELAAAALARAREGPCGISREAEIFAAELARIAGHDPEFLPPSWVSAGPALLVQLWINQGYHVDTMRAAAKAVMARRRGNGPGSPKYFAPIFTEAHTPHLPLRGKPQEVVSHGTAQNLPAASDWRSRRDAQHAAIDKLNAFIEAHDGDAAGGEGREGDLRMVSNA